jgi:hypothetical protein
MSEAYDLTPPDAGAMIESLRGIGYSPATAIADLIDNSVSAGARNVWLDFSFDGPASTIRVIDDGGGMSSDGLRRAMTLGGINPLHHRSLRDLGRFGLGLKTASFSQCRCLTVAAKSDGVVSIRRWDLDYIAQPNVGEWRLLSSPRTGSEDLIKPLDDLTSGTIVVWEGLDKIVGGAARTDSKAEDAFLGLAERIERHVGMVFHRFLEGHPAALRIFINGQRIKPWDPFLISHPATDPTPTETIPRADGFIELQGFVLPHKDQLSEEQFRNAGGIDGWSAHQGFYVYRNRRMLVSGGWLGLGEPRVWTMEESFKLARLRLEFPNSADQEWDIDVKKSVARPPRWLRSRITDLAERVRTSARQVFAHRGTYGRRAVVVDLQPAWIGHTINGISSYRINREHPAIERIVESAGNEAVEQMLRIIEETVPVQRIWLDTAENGEAPKQAFAEAASAEMEALARGMLSHLTGKVGLSRERALMQLRRTEPFQNYPELLEQLGTESGHKDQP